MKLLTSPIYLAYVMQFFWVVSEMKSVTGRFFPSIAWELSNIVMMLKPNQPMVAANRFKTVDSMPTSNKDECFTHSYFLDYNGEGTLWVLARRSNGQQVIFSQIYVPNCDKTVHGFLNTMMHLLRHCFLFMNLWACRCIHCTWAFWLCPVEKHMIERKFVRIQRKKEKILIQVYYI